MQRGKPGARPIRSFKDPSLTTGIFFLDLLEALRPGVVDPTLVLNVNENSDYEDRKQNGKSRYGLVRNSMRADLVCVRV